MDTSPNPRPKSASHHPLMLLAALAVLLFSLVGTAAIMGWLPSSVGGNAANRPLSDADRAALAAAMPPGSTAAPLAANTVPGQPYAAQPYPARPQSTEALPPGTYPVQPLAAAPAAGPAPAYAPAPPVRHERAAERVARAEPAREHWCATCGNIESIREYRTRAQGSGLGAGVGAVLGGLLGNQVGSGNGRTLATAAGAVGGAVAGNQVEGNMKATTGYEIRVRLDDGTVRTFHQHSAPAWRTGDRVKIVKGSLRRA